MTRLCARRSVFVAIATTGLVLATIAVTLCPEPSAVLLTPASGWQVKGSSESEVSLRSLGDTNQLLRRSVQRNPGARFWRTWTPNEGTQPLGLKSPPFVATAFISIPVTGVTSGITGQSAVWLEQVDSGQRLPIFLGSAHTSFNDVIVAMPPKWVGTEVTIGLASRGENNVGVGSAFSVTWISYLKSTILGRLFVLFSSMAMYGLLLITGATAAVALGFKRMSTVTALLSLGASSLGVFYASQLMQYAGVSSHLSVRFSVGACVLACLGCLWVWRRWLPATWETTRPIAAVWILTSLGLAALLGMATGGSGHWEPNFRFWPATWSSDHELPWRFAEAIRHGHRLSSIYGGGWMPTDRPPLMASALLMASEMIAVSRHFNDGAHLTGVSYNTVAIALNSLWLPLAFWLLTDCMRLTSRQAIIVIAFAATAPFSLFTTIYGWPKTFGAAYALACFGLIACRPQELPYRIRLILAAVCGGLSMLAHASVAFFLAPLALLAWIRRPQGSTSTLLAALAIACAIMGTWTAYKQLVLPSLDPLTKYALTQSFGFGRPDLSLIDMLTARYSGMTIGEWFELKRTAVVGALVPMMSKPSRAIEPFLHNASLIDTLRAWDFHVPTVGNALVLAATALAIPLAAWPPPSRSATPFSSTALLAVSLASVVLYLVVCLAPLVLHHLPHPAWFGLPLASGAILCVRAPRVLYAILGAQLAYLGVVWIMDPLNHALSIDLTAFLLISLVSAIAVRYVSNMTSQESRRTDCAQE